MRNWRRVWDSVARDYDVIWEVPDYTPILRSIVREVKIHSGMKVVDVATGTGMVSTEVAKKVGEHGVVLGIDFSRPMLRQALKKTRVAGLHNIHFVLADAHNLPLRDESFDAVTACFTFAFLSNPQKAAAEMARVIRSGGRATSVEWEKPPLEFWAELRKKGGIRDFPESEMLKVLGGFGFKRVRAKRVLVVHRRPVVSEESEKKSQLMSAKIMGLREKDAERFFQRIREEYRRLPPEKKSGWFPVIYVGIKR